jgi:hypothetical protein
MYELRFYKQMLVKSSVVSYWCTFGYLEINRLLRTGSVSPKNIEDIDFIQEDVDHLITAASQEMATTEVFRGLSLFSLPNAGETIEDKGLQSFSKSKEAAINFARGRAEQYGGVPVVFVLKTNKGFDIEAWAMTEGLSDGSESHQKEVLLPPQVKAENNCPFTE